MKALLANKQEVVLAGASRSYTVGDGKYTMSLDISASVMNFEMVTQTFTKENCENIVLTRDGGSDVTIAADDGWKLNNIYDFLSENESHVSVIFEK